MRVSARAGGAVAASAGAMHPKIVPNRNRRKVLMIYGVVEYARGTAAIVRMTSLFIKAFPCARNTKRNSLTCFLAINTPHRDQKPAQSGPRARHVVIYRPIPGEIEYSITPGCGIRNRTGFVHRLFLPVCAEQNHCRFPRPSLKCRAGRARKWRKAASRASRIPAELQGRMPAGSSGRDLRRNTAKQLENFRNAGHARRAGQNSVRRRWPARLS